MLDKRRKDCRWMDNVSSNVCHLLLRSFSFVGWRAEKQQMKRRQSRLLLSRLLPEK